MIQTFAAAAAAALGILLGMVFDAPKEWKEVPKGTFSMRLAEYTLPRADGDPEDATITLHHFGTNMGGSVDANVQRWLGQFNPKDGEPAIEKPKDGDKPKITWVDVAGTYVAETRPGSGQRLNKPGWRMIAAVVEAEDGYYFVKAVGPKATIAKNADAIKAYARSAKAQ